MDMDKKSVKIIWSIITGILVLWVTVSIFLATPSSQLSGRWIINDDEEIIEFYDNDICVIDGEEMTYRILDDNTLSLDGEVYEFEITDKKHKKMMLDEKD